MPSLAWLAGLRGLLPTVRVPRRTGTVAAVTSAVEAGARAVGKKGMLVNKIVIAHPRQELLSEMI
ncbi:MAG: BMC domain-containing protein [Acidobacteria bacterium]|nr:BMC domain-containing protein [Acidobacteriota bacterium]